MSKKVTRWICKTSGIDQGEESGEGGDTGRACGDARGGEGGDIFP